MTVSICIIAYNEEKFICNILRDVISQNYPHEKTEIVLVDSMSKDNTRSIMEKFAQKHKNEFMRIKVCENPKRSQAAGWNIAIENTAGDVIVRVDAHAKIPENFISENIRVIESGEFVSGGPRPNLTDENTPYKNMLLLAESSMFGSSAASYRRAGGEEKKYVNSLFHGAYRRQVFAEVGGFDEALGRTEDNELHYRIRKAGFKLCCCESIRSYQYIRGTLGSMLKQKFQNGRWIGLTLGYCPKCLSLFHFVPFAFVAALFLSLIFGIVGLCINLSIFAFPLILLLGLYGMADIFMSICAIIEAPKKHMILFLLPFVFFLLHTFYGLGTICGIVQLPFHLKKYGGSNIESTQRVKQTIQESMNKI